MHTQMYTPCTHMCTYVYTHVHITHTCIHTCVHTLHRCIHMHMHAQIHMYRHYTCTHKYICCLSLVKQHECTKCACAMYSSCGYIFCVTTTTSPKLIDQVAMSFHVISCGLMQHSSLSETTQVILTRPKTNRDLVAVVSLQTCHHDRELRQVWRGLE